MASTEQQTDLLRKTVAQRWEEIASYALRQCADGYNRGYVLIKSENTDLAYVPVEDRPRATAETIPPYTLDEAVLARQNCEDFIVVAMTVDGAFTWSVFSEVGGRTAREAAGSA